MKIGALLPASRMFPAVAQDFVAGLRGALADGELNCELIIEPVGNCAVKDLVIDKVQRLLLQHAPDVIVGIMGSGLSRHVHTLFSDAGTPFIMNDLGADPLMTGGSHNPYVFCNSLNLWQSAYALGYWASQNLGSRACIAAALHEAGYGIVPAFWAGFQGAGGGTILTTEVTHRHTADEDPTAHLERLAAHHPDIVMGFYSGREGISFLKAYSALGLSGKFALLATPLMMHEHWLPGMGDAATGIRTAFCWDRGANPDEHERFRRACNGAATAEPAVFTLLGYETGMMLCQAVTTGVRKNATGSQLRDALSGIELKSPRGTLRIDPKSGEESTTDYLQQVQRQQDGTLAMVTHAPLELPVACKPEYAAVQASNTRSGWLNPYLVT